MSKQINDGGPAFPSQVDAGGSIMLFPGASLRDWFAGQVLQQLCGTDYKKLIREHIEKHGIEATADAIEQCVAIAAYKQADAMLEARKGGAK